MLKAYLVSEELSLKLHNCPVCGELNSKQKLNTQLVNSIQFVNTK